MSLRHLLNSDVNITASYRILVKTPTGILALRKPFLGTLLCELLKYIKRSDAGRDAVDTLGYHPKPWTLHAVRWLTWGPTRGPTWTAALQNGIFCGAFTVYHGFTLNPKP